MTDETAWLREVATVALLNEAGAWNAAATLRAAVDQALTEADPHRARVILQEGRAAYDDALLQQMNAIPHPRRPP